MHSSCGALASRSSIRTIGRRFLICGGVASALMLALGAFSAQTATDGTIIDVRKGDTFSAIAGRFAEGAGSWSKMYRHDLSGLPNPNLILVGMRFEVATDAGGAKYLRVMSGTAAAAPRAAAAPAPAPMTPAAAPAAPAAAAVPVPPPQARVDDALVVGVLPYIQAAILNTQYESLKRYLERVDGQKVRIVVPGNFKAFFDSTMNGDYDIAVAAPHFARVAQLDRNMVPLGMFEPRINALFVTPMDSKMLSARDAREKPIAFANPQSLVAMFGQQWLRQQNMEPGRDYETKAARTDLGVGRMLLSGDAVAAIMSNGEFRALPPEESSRLKILESFASIPNFVFVANPRLDRERTARLKTQLKAFLADKEDGAAFARATNFTAIVDADEAQMRELDSHTAATRRAMGYTK